MSQKDKKLNRYYSPEIAIDYLIDNTTVDELRRENIKGQKILEPCAGGGSLVRPLVELGATVTTNDIDMGTKQDHMIDVMRRMVPGKFDGVVTNPPFLTYKPVYDDNGKQVMKKNGDPKLVKDSHASDFLRRFAMYDVDYIATLLRLSFLEPCADRVEIVSDRWLTSDGLPNPEGFRLVDMIVTPRIKFKGDGTDNVTTAWLVFKAAKLCEDPLPPMTSSVARKVLAAS